MGTSSKYLYWSALKVRTVELPLHPPAQANPVRELTAKATLSEPPPYIAEGVRAVAEGIQTSQGFARARGISITNASERSRTARRLG